MSSATTTSVPADLNPHLRRLAQALTTGGPDERALAVAAAAHHLLTNRHALAAALDRLGPHPTVADVTRLLRHRSRMIAAADLEGGKGNR